MQKLRKSEDLAHCWRKVGKVEYKKTNSLRHHFHQQLHYPATEDSLARYSRLSSWRNSPIVETLGMARARGLVKSWFGGGEADELPELS